VETHLDCLFPSWVARLIQLFVPIAMDGMAGIMFTEIAEQTAEPHRKERGKEITFLSYSFNTPA